ncbi:MAG TPA: acyl-CoA dehydrogenase family protein [Stellaceae bacterium]|jgi:3-hydroxy-9,10-secoandrosta-1,3,5(10)-triene-9,17-dione monooxygenase|nr:acyl-CoA dehydrogenase family protein [Stellaceae bacterium]
MNDDFAPAAAPEPHLTQAEMIARAQALAPAVRAEAPAAETRGYYSHSLHDRFREAGFYRIFVPRRFGGYEFDFPTYYRIMVEIATADPGIGWCVALGASHALHVASYFPPAAQEKIFGPTRDFIAPGSLPARAKPQCVATPDGDGYRISGKWPYASGSPYSTHLLGGAHIKDAPDQRLMIVVPRDQYEVLEDWGAILGLKGSGSNTIEVKDGWIPRDFALPMDRFGPSGTDTPGWRLHGNALYAGQFMGYAGGALACSQVGAAKAAMAEYERIVRTSRAHYGADVLKFQHPDFQRVFGLGMSMTLSAEALLLSTGQLYMDYSRGEVTGDPFTPLKAYQMMGMHHQIIRLAWEAGLEFFRAASSSNALDGQPMQRFFRDLATFKNNATHQADFFAPEIARAYFGLPGEYTV